MLQTSAETSLQEILSPISNDLDKMEILIENIISSQESLMGEIVGHVRHFQGKRLRPALVLLSGRLFDPAGQHQQALVHLAAITELVHTCTLIHDDIIDKADARRNSDTFNKKWDNNIAVIFGDYLFSKAFSMTVSIEDRVIRSRLAEVISDLCEGEIMQLHGRNAQRMDEEFYNRMILLKTATFLGCCTGMGARTAGASEESVGQLTQAGEHLGSAFQIVDDCLDLMGNEGVMGKSLGTDLATGKFTLPLIKVIEHLSPEKIEEFKQLFKSGHGSQVKSEVLELARQTGAVDDAWREAERHTQKAIDFFSSLPEGETREHLIGLAHYLITRSH